MAVGGQVVKIALQADVGGFVKNFAEADTVTGKLGATLSGLANVGQAGISALEAIGEKAQASAKHIAAFGAGAILTFGGMGLAAAQLETRLKNVQSLLGEQGAKEFQANFEGVLAVTREFPVSANDAADALYNITSSGLSGADALKVLHVTAMAASAGMTTMENASTGLMAVLNAFGLPVSKVKDVSDTLFQTVNLGVLHFEDLTSILGETAGSAAAAGIRIEELGSAVATMTLSGISADEAGTSLNRLIQSLIDPSKELTATFKMLGFESGQQAISMLGLHGVMEKLRIASGGTLATLLQWFPEIRAARGALALMANDGENYARVAGQIENAQARAGATQRAFNAQAESTSQSFQKFINALHAAAIEIGQYFLPPAKLILNVLTEIVGAFEQVPGPIKAAIGYFGMFSGILLALGGIYAAFRLKTLVVDTALNLLGGTIQKIGQSTAVGGAAVSNFGQKIQDTTGPFRLARVGVVALTEGMGRIGGVVAAGGSAISGFSEKLGPAGGIVNRFGTALQGARRAGDLFTGALGAVGGAVAGMLKFLPAIAAFGIAVFSAFQHGRSEAQAFADSITKDLNVKSPESLVKNLNQINDAIDKIKAKQGGGGGDFGFITQFAKDLGDLATNVVGIDVIKDSTWDNFFKIDSLTTKQRMILQSMKNLQENATNIWNQLHPDQRRDDLLGLRSQDLADIAVAAQKAGVDLTNAFEHSGPARDKMVEEIRKMSGYFDNVGLSGTKLTESMIKNFEDMRKAEDKAATGASDAVTKNFDVIKGVADIQKQTSQDAINQLENQKRALGDHSAAQKKAIDDQIASIRQAKDGIIPLGEAIGLFYDQAIAKSTDFYSNIEELQKRHMDPVAIQKFLQAGPDAAGAIVQAAVDDASGGIIDVINKGEAALAKFAARAAEMARLTQRAIGDPTDQLTKVLPQAQQIANQVFQQGKLASIESVAFALSMDPASVEKIVGQFGITLGHAVTSIDFLPPGALDTQKTALTDLFNALQTFGGLDPEAAANVVKQFWKGISDTTTMPGTTPEAMAARMQKLQEMKKTIQDMPNLSEEQKGVIIKVLGDEESKIRLEQFRAQLEKFGGGGGSKFTEGWAASIDYAIQVTGQPDAVQKLQTFMDVQGLIPSQKEMLLRAVGTPEAIAAADQVKGAIDILTGKNLPITADNVDAIIKAQQAGEKVATIEGREGFRAIKIDADSQPAETAANTAQTSIDGVHQDHPPDIVVIDNASGVVATIHSDINSLQDKTVTVTVLQKQIFQAASQSGASPGSGEYSGAIFSGRGVRAFQRGGEMHTPMISRGRWPYRIWSEPESGGESYIPWATKWRTRATEILGRTASAFGMDLVRQGQGVRAANFSLPASASARAVQVTTALHINGNFYGDRHLTDTIDDALQAHDRKLETELTRSRSAF